MKLALTCIALLASSLDAAQDLTELAELVAADGLPNDFLGGAAAVSERTAVIGAVKDVLAPGVPGPPPGAAGAQGSAYVFLQSVSGGPFLEVAKLSASDATLGDRFGEAVAIDQDTIVVGAREDGLPGIHSAGSAYVFERSQGGPEAWGQVVKLLGSDPEIGAKFGHAVAVWGDTIAVGAYGQNALPGEGSGTVYVFDRNQGGPGAWGQVAKLKASLAGGVPGREFGRSLWLEDSTLAIGAFDAANGLRGAAYIFERDLAGVWTEIRTITVPSVQPVSGFGDALAGAGDTLVVGSFRTGANNEGAAFVFDRDQGGPNAWGQIQQLVAGDPVANSAFGASVAIHGNRILVGCARTTTSGVEVGGAYVFDRAGVAFGPGVKLTASDGSWRDQFGSAVALSPEVALVGAGGGDQGGAFVEGLDGLAFDPLQNRLFGADQDASLLLEIDPSTGTATPIGPLGFSMVQALAFDPNTGSLYGASSGAFRALYQIDTTTGAGTKLGDLVPGSVLSLAFDPLADKLYGFLGSPANKLVEIDTATAAVTILGSFSGRFLGLGFDVGTGWLFASDTSTNMLVRIDPASPAIVPIGPLGSSFVYGLASGPAASPFYGAANISTSNVLAIDLTSGAGAVIGPYSTATVVDSGTAYLFTSFSSGTATYCTAGLSSSGCQAALAATGIPSATASSGFDLSASSVEGAKSGLFYFGTSGRQANPWGNGSSFQCVVPPVARAGLLTGGGTNGQCDGAFSQDLNALWCPTCPKPQKNPGAGTTVQAQLWHRDPVNTSNQTTSLSNAIEFCLAP